MMSLRLAAGAVAACLLAGCATQSGVNFDRQKAAGFVPGQATKAQVLAALGPPWSEQTYTSKKDMADKELPSPAIVSELRYFYTDRQLPARPADVEPSRNAFYLFNAGTLMSYWVISTFAEDSTDFDENAAARLVKGKTTEQEVIALLGRPAGRGIHPAAQQVDGSLMTYEAFLYRPRTNQRTYKTLRVFLDRNKVVTDYELNVRSR